MDCKSCNINFCILVFPLFLAALLDSSLAVANHVGKLSANSNQDKLKPWYQITHEGLMGRRWLREISISTIKKPAMEKGSDPKPSLFEATSHHANGEKGHFSLWGNYLDSKKYGSSQEIHQKGHRSATSGLTSARRYLKTNHRVSSISNEAQLPLDVQKPHKKQQDAATEIFNMLRKDYKSQRRKSPIHNK